ncbi:MAG: CehA/McbA family metallohydrolase [Phycisphaerales bacterium]|nr:CehA/McbA family metallohydrolase [Phycisphaerales bacterium]
MFKPSAADGQGSAVAAPQLVDVSSPVTIRIRFTVGAPGIAVGGGVRFCVPKFWGWSPPHTRDPEAPGFATVALSRTDASLEVNALPSDGFVFAVVRGAPLIAGDEVTFTYGDTADGLRPGAQGISDRFAERGERFFIKVDGDGDGFYTPLAQQPTLSIRATRADRLVCFAPSQARVGERFEVTLAALDRTLNLVESHVSDAISVIVAGPQPQEAPIRIQVKESDRGAIRFSVTPKSPGVIRVRVEDGDHADLQPATSNPILVNDASPRPYSLFWGDLQIHTQLSDGTGDPGDVYRYARDVARLDVAAITDHDHWGYQPLDADLPAWRRILDLNRKWTRPGAFVTFPGYEWTNWTHGHRHVLFAREEDAVIFSYADKASDHPLELWKQLGDRDCVTISHHCGGGPIPTFWRYWDAKYEPVVEMVSVHGASEMMGHPRCIYSPVASGMAQAALARGLRLGMIGSGDTHDGHPGLGSPGQRAGLAGIWAKALTRDAILEALRARRVYATTGCRALLRFHSGKVAMGGVLRLDDPSQPRTFSISVVADAAAVQSVTVVKNNEPVVTVPGTGFVEALEWSDEAPARNGDYYYARIVQEDNEWIWSSPIWIEFAPRREGDLQGSSSLRDETGLPPVRE